MLESWARHLLTAIHRWEDDGIAPLHREYAGLAYGLGEAMTYEGQSGTFLGLDEALRLLFKTGTGTVAIPLTRLLEERP